MTTTPGNWFFLILPLAKAYPSRGYTPVSLLEPSRPFIPFDINEPYWPREISSTPPPCLGHFLKGFQLFLSISTFIECGEHDKGLFFRFHNFVKVARRQFHDGGVPMEFGEFP